MASPAASDADNPQQTKAGQVTFRFCRECSNMLYPAEDRQNNVLMFQCRTCRFTEPAASSCVYRNNLSDEVGETAGVTQDIGQDPTLPRASMSCPKCKNDEVVFFQSQQRTSDTGMKIFYVCCACGHIFQ